MRCKILNPRDKRDWNTLWVIVINEKPKHLLYWQDNLGCASDEAWRRYPNSKLIHTELYRLDEHGPIYKLSKIDLLQLTRITDMLSDGFFTSRIIDLYGDHA